MFHLNYRETGAIILRLEDIFRDINWIVNFSGYSNGAFDFVVVEPTFIYGICIERFEYWDTFMLRNFLV
ncbi:YxiF family protein [Lysinibacillus sphaericus]|uniref:YxiF family protein n=1 Tax=Lysinibacillus sphaericus TaxID=1421 RepID=UPI003D729945